MPFHAGIGRNIASCIHIEDLEEDLVNREFLSRNVAKSGHSLKAQALELHY